MHYYQHHIGDFIKDTANLNDHQLATYLRMLWSYYSEERPLGKNLEDLAFAMRSDEKTIGLILRHYFKEAEDGWHHGRCDREIADFHTKKDKAAASANARWKNAKNKTDAKQALCDSNATVCDRMQAHENHGVNAHSSAAENASSKRPDCERNANASKTDANQEPITNNQSKEPPIPPEGAAAGFAEFWSAYPLKKAKATAEKAWAKLKPSADLQAAILSAIAAHKLSADWQRDGGQYIPHPTTWLNQRRWEDEVTHARSQRPDQNRPRSAVDEVREAIWRREAAEAAAAAAGQAVVEDGGDLRPALDGEFRRVG